MLNTPKKEEKNKYELINLIRILAWQQYKLENSNSKGLELYEQFLNEWNDHEIHKMNSDKIKKFTTDLGYTIEELKDNAQEYYDKQKAFKVKAEIDVSEPSF